MDRKKTDNNRNRIIYKALDVKKQLKLKTPTSKNCWELCSCCVSPLFLAAVAFTTLKPFYHNLFVLCECPQRDVTHT